MPIELVEIVNPNGRKGLVAATSHAAAAYKRSPSTREARIPDGDPSETWTAKQLTAYAAENGVDLDALGARPTKAELLAAITAAHQTSTSDNNDSTNESQED